MTKKWSSTATMDGQTKREASKAVRREVARAIRQIEDGDFEEVDPMTADDRDSSRADSGKSNG